MNAARVCFEQWAERTAVSRLPADVVYLQILGNRFTRRTGLQDFGPIVTSQKPSTIRDVAQVAGVSITAVSRYLNKQLFLPAGTASRVDAAVVELGFRPNAIARRLSRGTSETLGFVTSDIAHPFFAAIASAAEEEAAKRGYTLAMFNTRNEISKELGFLSRIEDQQVDGILFLTNHPDDGTLRDKINRCRHVVLLDEDVAGAEVPLVLADSERGGRIATRHLIEKGHRRIGFVSGPKPMRSSVERFRGFRGEMKAAGLAVETGLVKFGLYEEEFGVRAFQALYASPDPPTAIFAAADMLAIGIIRGALESGLSVPADLSVVGFADMLHVNLLNPPLTTVRQSTAHFGRRGIELLVENINGAAKPDRPERVPVELVERGSVTPPRKRRS
jgi:LacI family transcriptional regulator